MKKYLQACELNGSIYGTKRTTNKKSRFDRRYSGRKNLIGSYGRFYKKQFNVLNKFFKHDR